MLANFYQKSIIEKPKLIFTLLLICLICFGYYSKNFRLDASSETLLIEGDPDLKYLNEISERYGSRNFLILTYSPKEKMISSNTIKNLNNLKTEIENLNWVHSVITILDVPLLSSTDKPLVDRIQNYETLKSKGVDKKRGFNEILNSPVFKNFVISEDGKTSGIIVYLKNNKPNREFKNKQEEEEYKDNIKKQNHKNIIEIRKIIKNLVKKVKFI